MLTLRGGRKKTYPIDFSLKFKEIKILHCAYELVNPGKMFTYFYNKFRPVNRMYYIKCGVNSSLCM